MPKAQRTGATIQFDVGFSEELPYSDASFDRVLSAFMLHHVRSDAKLPTIREACRVLKPGGSLHLADFDEGQHHWDGFLASVLHSRHGSSSHQIVLGLMGDAGFQAPQEVAHETLTLGRIVYYKAVRPLSALSNRNPRLCEQHSHKIEERVLYGLCLRISTQIRSYQTCNKLSRRKQRGIKRNILKFFSPQAAGN